MCRGDVIGIHNSMFTDPQQQTNKLTDPDKNISNTSHAGLYISHIYITTPEQNLF